MHAGIIDFSTFSTDSILPGSSLQSVAVNDKGAIVGYAFDASTFSVLGFERSSDGTLTPLTLSTGSPGQQVITYPDAINDAGTIVGNFFDYSASSPPQPEGFILTSDGTLTAVPNYSLNGINNVGDIEGWDVFNIYIFQDGTPAPLFPPGGNHPSVQYINDVGQISGLEIPSLNPNGVDVNEGFVGTIGGSITPFAWPAAPCNEAQSHAIGFVAINDSGEIAGYCEDQAGNMYSFYGTPGNFTLFQVPGSVSLSTKITGVSNTGEIVGIFNNGTENEGFTGTVTPEPATAFLTAAGICLALLRRKKRPELSR